MNHFSPEVQSLLSPLFPEKLFPLDVFTLYRRAVICKYSSKKEGGMGRVVPRWERNLEKSGIAVDENGQVTTSRTFNDPKKDGREDDTEYAEFDDAEHPFHKLLELCDIIHALSVSDILQEKGIGEEYPDEEYPREEFKKRREYAIEHLVAKTALVPLKSMAGEFWHPLLLFIQSIKIEIAEISSLRRWKPNKYPATYEEDGQKLQIQDDKERKQLRDAWEVHCITNRIKEKLSILTLSFRAKQELIRIMNSWKRRHESQIILIKNMFPYKNTA